MLLGVLTEVVNMNVNKLLKAAASAAAGALMIGATLSGAALAQTLGDFPSPFVDNGVMNSVIVVGSQGTDPAGLASDVVGAIDIAAAIGQATIKKTSSASTTGTVTISSAGGEGVTKNIHFGQYIAKTGSENQFKPVLKHDDLSGLKNTDQGASKIMGNDGTSVDYHEELALDGAFDSAANDHINLNSRSNFVAEYRGTPGINLANNKLRYLIVFDDSLNKGNDNTVITCSGTGNDVADADLFPLTNIRFLGSELEIKCSQFNPSMTISLGQKITLNQGQSIPFEDFKITLAGLDILNGNKASFNVEKGGSVEPIVINENAVGTITKWGLSIKVDKTFPGATGGIATIIVGSNLDSSVSNSNDYLSTSDWDWIIDPVTVSKPIIGVAYNPSNSWTGEKIMKEGQSVSFPGDVLSIANQGLYVTTTGQLKINSVNQPVYDATGTSTTADIIEITFDAGSDPLTVATVNNLPVNSSSTTGVRQVRGIRMYFGGNGNTLHITYKDTNNQWTNMGANYTNIGGTGAQFAALRYDNTLLYLGYTNSSGYGNLTVKSIDTDGTTAVDTIAVLLEASSSGAMINDGTTNVLYIDSNPTTDVGANSWPCSNGCDRTNYDYTLYTLWGLYVADPKGVQSGYLAIDVPNDRQRLKVFVGVPTGEATDELSVGETIPGTSSVVKSINAAGAESMTAQPINAPVAKLDSEVTSTERTSTNLILVGGPSVNLLVRDLGVQASEFKDATGNPIGKIKLFSGAFTGMYKAIVVAGWDAQNTRAAAYVLAHYGNWDNQLSGKTQVSVTGTQTQNLNVA